MSMHLSSSIHPSTDFVAEPAWALRTPSLVELSISSPSRPGRPGRPPKENLGPVGKCQQLEGTDLSILNSYCMI